MKSYVLAIALAMLVAAGFVFQNPGIVTVHFLIWTRELPQGVWEVALFAAGGILMWGVSLVAMMEVRNKYRREIRSRDRRVQELQEERDSLVNALNSLGPVAVEPEEAFSLKEPEEEISRLVEGEVTASADETSFERREEPGLGSWSPEDEPKEVREAGEEQKSRLAKEEGDQGLF